MRTAGTKVYDRTWRLLKMLIILCCGNAVYSQSCPDNIGFEKGSFEGWQCSDGSIDTAGILHLYPTSPIYNTHTLIGRDQAGVKDEYGGFPVLCPNGSKYSIRLGNDGTGARSEGLSYT
ncbi:MAG: hypothetical protein K0Q66_2339, partial [Chitinophagaceae bacterium]|nr:hypothetical protein [Chitinophagaceae bacterium]